MAITYIGAGTPWHGQANSSTPSLGRPASVQAGDLLIALLGNQSGYGDFSASGWTNIGKRANTDSSGQLQVLTKIATSSEPNTYTFTASTSGVTDGVMLAYRGAQTSVGFAGTAPASKTGTATAPPTTVTPGAVSVFAFAAYTGNGNSSAFTKYPTNQTPPPVTDRYCLQSSDPTSPTTGQASFTGYMWLKIADYFNSVGATSGIQPDGVLLNNTGAPGMLAVALTLASVNAAPNAGGKPTPDGQTLDRTVAQSFSYAFSDPDAGDQPSKTDWRWRTSPVSGTPGSWNTSTVTGNGTSITYPANTFPAGRIELQVLPYDSQGVVAPAWSDSAFDTAANPPTAPTFSAPAAGSTIATVSVTATIVADTLDAHQWRVMGDTSGTANTTVVNAGATIEDPTSRTFTVTGLANAQTVHLQDRRRVGGIWSPWADNGAQAVSYTPPPPATIVLTPLPTSAKLSVAWTIPAPTGSEPAVSTVDVYVDDGSAEGLHVKAGTGAKDRAPGASPWVHDTPALLREYGNGTGRVVVVVKGANGTTRTTAS